MACLYEKTLFFPGWEATVDEKLIDIYPTERGLIALTIPKGEHTLNLVYNDILILKLLKITSITGFVLLIILLINDKYKPYNKRK